MLTVWDSALDDPPTGARRRSSTSCEAVRADWRDETSFKLKNVHNYINNESGIPRGQAHRENDASEYVEPSCACMQMSLHTPRQDTRMPSHPNARRECERSGSISASGKKNAKSESTNMNL
jgi:hypothetical protein